MPLNTKPLNTEIVNAIPPGGIGFIGTVFAISQQLQITYSGSVLGITQNIKYLATQSSSNVFSVSQKIQVQPISKSVFSITQMVIST